MKRLLLLLSLSMFVTLLYGGEQRKMITRYNTLTKSYITTPLVTIRDMQYDSPDSLRICDSLQSIPSWVYQQGALCSYTAGGTATRNDTVTVVALVIAPAKVITYTQHGWSMLIEDTGKNVSQWGGILVRVGLATDTAQAALDHFLNVSRGDIIMITGRVEEFPAPPTASCQSTTQLNPIPGIEILNVSSGNPIPPPIKLNVQDVYRGQYPGGTINNDTGEVYEGMMVKFTNLTVRSIINDVRGTWDMIDASGNVLSDYDASYYFTFGSSETPPTIPDTSVTHFHMPPVGATVDSIKGFLTVASGGENPRGFRICPLYPGDVAFRVTLPTISTHRRFPVIPTPDDSVRVTVFAQAVSGGFPLSRVMLFKSVNNAPWIADTMVLVDTPGTFQDYLLDQDGNPLPGGTQVRYFLKARDTQGKEAILANASTAFGADTSQGVFFFNVVSGQLTIHDIQYTPYNNGLSPYNGGVATVGGIVTADTSDIGVTALNTGGTSAWYVQSGSGPWTASGSPPATR